MSHDHHVKPSDPSTRVLGAILLNGLITLVEFVGGLLSNSLALISDAVHNLSDTLALALAWTAIRVGKRKPTEKKTFGYKRFEILSAFINASILTGLSVYLIYEAIQRFLHPEPVHSFLMLIVATIGLGANAISVLFLHRDSKQSLNVKAAYLHLLGDTFSSVAVIGGAIVILLTEVYWIDPLLTLLISLVIIYHALRILRESTDILMQGTPGQIKLDDIKSLIEGHSMVSNIHHVHCWQLQDNHIHFEAHIEIKEDIPVSRSSQLIEEIEQLLREQCNITHTTLQVEFGHCDDKTMIRNSVEVH